MRRVVWSREARSSSSALSMISSMSGVICSNLPRCSVFSGFCASPRGTAQRAGVGAARSLPSLRQAQQLS